MKILVATTASDIYCEKLLVALALSGYEVGLLSDPKHKDTMLQRSPNVPVLAYVSVNGRFDVHARDQYAQHIQTFQPDIILTYTTRALNLMVLAANKVKNPAPIIGHRGALGGLSFFNPLDWLTYFNPRVNAIVCFSRAVEQALIQSSKREILPRFLKKPKYLTIYQGCDFLLEKLTALDDAVFNFSVIANDRPVKGMDLLLDAVALLLERESNFKVNIYGEMSSHLVDRVKLNDRLNSAVILHGYTKNARFKLDQAHAYIQPTLAPGEGFGNAVAEAMGFGLPVITSNVGAALELVVDKETGLFFDADNALSLATSMASLIAMPLEQRKSMGMQGQQRLLRHFSLDRSVAAYSALFIELQKK